MPNRKVIIEVAIFFVLSAIVLAFILLQHGLWTYLDNAFYLEVLSGDKKLLSNLYIFNNSGISFGADKGLHNIFRIANKLPLIFTFGGFLPLHIGQGVTMFLILSVFYTTTRFLAKLLGSEHYMILGLFFAFNPVALYLLNQSAHALVYASFPLIWYAMLRILKTRQIDWVGVLLLVVGINFLLSYPRVTIIYILLLGVTGLIYLLKQYKSIEFFWKKIVVVSVVVLMTHLFVFNNLSFLKFVDSEYTSGPGEYAKSASVQYGPIAYRSNENKSQFDAIMLNEITQNYNKNTYAATAHKLISLMLLLVFLVAFFRSHNTDSKKNMKLFVGLGLFSFSVSILLLGKFVNEALFINFTYHWVPAFQNNTNWAYIVLVIAFVVLLDTSLDIFDKTKKIQTVAYGIIFIYICSGIVPMLNFHNIEELQLVDPTNIPNVVKYEFFNNKPKEATIQYPSSQLIFQWSPYPINLGSYSARSNLLSSNKRLVTQKHANLYNSAVSMSKYKNFALLNLQNIFVHKNIENNINKLPYYTKQDLIAQSKDDYEKLKNDDGLKCVEDNEEFAKFKLNIDKSYDFRLYSPTIMHTLDVGEFVDEELSIEKRPVIIPTDAFKRSVYISDKQEFQNVKVKYKRANINTNAYYVELSDIDNKKDLLMQLNQTYSPNWKVYGINQGDFDNIECVGKYVSNSMTNNSFCLYNQKVFNINNLKLLRKSMIKEVAHFEGNFIGNGWILAPEDLRDVKDDKMYVVVVYQKQVYFMITLFISLVSFLVVVLLALMQVIKNIKSKYVK